MPFTLIEGTFKLLGKDKNGRVRGFQPDGDSLQFRPKRATTLDRLEVTGHPAQPTAIGSVNLRFEGIDAAELHFQGERQPPTLPEDARDDLTRKIGMNPVHYSPSGTTVVPPAKDNQPGFILSKQLDVHGRPVSFVFVGAPPAADGTSVRVDAALLRKSLNYKLLADGVAYPLFYDTLYHDLRDALTTAANRARSQRKGVWRVDKSNGAHAGNLLRITTGDLIFPKLFRRLVDFFAAGNTHLSDLPAWMDTNKENDEVFILSKMNKTHFDNILKITGGTIAVIEPLTNLMFVSRHRSKLRM